MFGVAYRRGLLTGRGGAACRRWRCWRSTSRWCALGPYELSLVGIEEQRLANMTPPSLLLAGHAIMMCA